MLVHRVLPLGIIGLIIGVGGFIASCRSDVQRTATNVSNGVPARVNIDLIQLSADRRLPDLTVVDVDDPVYGRRMKYEGYRLADVIFLALGSSGAETKGKDLFFHCADGYTPSMPLDDAVTGNGVLARRDLNAPVDLLWQTFRQGKDAMTPAPFYLVWPTSRHDAIWPYQIQHISIADHDAVYAATYAGDSGTASDGEKLFKRYCIACHSVNLIGGSVGPELNVPRNVLEYWSESNVRLLIRNASSFRAQSKMPAFDIPNSEVDALVTYLNAMKKRKIVVH
jgi:mono/diheme cytochrome c family protein